MHGKEVFDTAEATIPGIIGAAGALLWINAPWPNKIMMFALGATLAYVGADYIAVQFGIPVALSGFLIGLFGMSVVDAIFKAPLAGIVVEFLRAKLGLPPKE